MKIEHIDEIRPHVDGRPDFVIAERDGYCVIDYVYTDETTFDEPIRAECRGIKFDENGYVSARPFHKFYNIGEKPTTQPHLLDFGSPYTVTSKLDGSMIHPCPVADDIVFMTRMGRSDHAITAERHLTDEMKDACREALHNGLTPIFEWTAPDNRIVIRYQESKLTLLAVRQTVEGGYLNSSDTSYWAKRIGVEKVMEHNSEWKDGHGFVEFARAITDAEGFVIRFSDGLWVKAKGDDYVMKHRAKDSIGLEKNALTVILENGVDDVLPLLSQDDADDLIRYRDAVLAGVDETAKAVENICLSGNHLDQKTFAVDHLKGIDGAMKSLAFQVRAGKNARDVVVQSILKNTSSQTKVDEVRKFFNASWGL
jgi:RNA ligase